MASSLYSVCSSCSWFYTIEAKESDCLGYWVVEKIMNDQKSSGINTLAGIVKFADIVLLCIVGIATLIATGQELWSITQSGTVKLADLMLLFIFAEILGMVGVSIKSSRIPITLTLFIAMTALARFIILQDKEMETVALLYESISILLIAGAVLVIRFADKKYSDHH